MVIIVGWADAIFRLATRIEELISNAYEKKSTVGCGSEKSATSFWLKTLCYSTSAQSATTRNLAKP
jgi:hypothetical protein